MSDRTPDPVHRSARHEVDAQNPSCGARTRGGAPCRNLPMRNGRCRMHGGASTGPRTAEGIERHRQAVTRHGGRSQATRDFRAAVRQLRADARKMIELA